MRGASSEVLRVSLADKLHNARSILSDSKQLGSDVWKKFNVGKEESLWFYNSLLEIYQAATESFLVKELKNVLIKLEKV